MSKIFYAALACALLLAPALPLPQLLRVMILDGQSAGTVSRLAAHHARTEERTGGRRSVFRWMLSPLSFIGGDFKV